ncbi:hypothetical protein ACIO13_21050 [Streptomyces sp. NPDC087425]|uniref:hypothetical protein n=1 Tax=Streptomyces sp. NPDC087425 TaxID=3365787 RepID=UPI00380C35DF
MRTAAKWTGGVTALVLLLVGLNWWSTGEPFGLDGPRALNAPAVHYLRPHGDRHGLAGDRAIVLTPKGGSETGSDPHRITADVEPGSQDVVALRENGPDCTRTGTHIACTVAVGGATHPSQARVTALAAPGSHVGDVGHLRFTFTRGDGKVLTARTEVVVGEPVVEIGRPAPVKDVRPGAVVSLPFVVRNTGERPVEGLGVRFSSGEMELAEHNANCRYPQGRRHYAVCRFPDLRIAPGETVVLRPALRVRVSKTLMYDEVTQSAWPLDVGPGGSSAWPNGGDQGDGPPLTPTSGPPPGALTFAQGDARTSVGLALRSDYAVFAGDLRGAPGTERRLDVTVRNAGPGDPGARSSLVFTPPPGTEVTEEPMEEIDEDAYEPYCRHEKGSYVCGIGELAPGKSRTFTFTVRLGEPGAGSVRLKDWPLDPSDPPDQLSRLGRQDPDPTNDTTSVTVLG